MKKVISLLLVAALTFPVSALAPDKEKHLNVSAAIAGISQLTFEDWRVSLTLCGAAGLSKEVYDEFSYGGFDKKDLAADAVGCAVGLLVGDTLLKGLSWDASRGIQYSIKFQM